MPDSITDVHYPDIVRLLEDIKADMQINNMILIAIARAKGIELPAEVYNVLQGESRV